MKYSALILFFLSPFLILQNTSCVNGNKYPVETKTLDSLQILVIRADSAVKAIDTSKIVNCTSHVMKDMEIIQMAHVDSMSAEAAGIFRNFNGIKWSLVSDAGKIKPLLTELEKSQKQLSHLSHDLKHDLVTADSVGFYVSFETKKATEFMQTSNISISDAGRQLSLYTIIAPKADSLMSLLKNHKQI